MSNKEFKDQISLFKTIIKDAGITMQNGDEVNDVFFRLLLGVGESTFKRMIYGKDSMRAIQPYIARHMRTLSLLDKGVFLNEIKLIIEDETNKKID